MRNNKIGRTTLIAVLLIGGCIVRDQYVVRDASPGSIVTVVPATRAETDVAAADHVMEVLIAAGANVIERPVMIKERSDFRSGTETRMGTDPGQPVDGRYSETGARQTSVDPVSLISETKADYVFIAEARGAGYSFRLVKRSTGQILHVGTFRDQISPACCLTWFGYSTEKDEARKLLLSVGIMK
jgi:hypothetical protein